MQIDELTIKSWDDLVAASPQSNPYARSTFLNCMTRPVHLLAFDFGKGERIGLMISQGEKAEAVGPFPYSCYQGIFFPPSNASPLRRHNQLAEILAFVENEFTSCAISLHPTIVDIRAAQWHNYGTEKRKFQIDIRYTGIIDLENGDKFGIQGLLSSSRKGDLKKSIKSGSLINRSNDVKSFISLYKETFQRQGMVIHPKQLLLVERIVQMHLNNNTGTLIFATVDNVPHAAALFLHDDACAYYAFAAQSSDFRDLGGGTAVFSSYIEIAKAKGLRYIDTIGINSPSRGNFKLGFGAQPQIYFNLILNEFKR